MTPNLPPNPSTITDTRINHLCLKWIGVISEMPKEAALARIQAQLDLIYDYDNYHRETNAYREFVKQVLLNHQQRILNG